MSSKTERKRQGRRSKRKGKVYERYIAELLREFFPRAMRGIGQARAAGEVPDVKGTPFWIEAKHRQRLNVAAAFAQARAGLADYVARGGSPRDYLHPLVVARLDDGTNEVRTDLAVLDLRDFLSLYAELLRLRAGGAPPPAVAPSDPSPPQNP